MRREADFLKLEQTLPERFNQFNKFLRVKMVRFGGLDLGFVLISRVA